MDFIGQFENIQKDYDKICKKIKITKRKLPHVFKSKHDHYSKYYTKYTKQIVKKIYAKDIKTFNYKFKDI